MIDNPALDRSALITEGVELQAANKLTGAAEEPAALHLRLLQTVAEVATEEELDARAAIPRRTAPLSRTPDTAGAGDTPQGSDVSSAHNVSSSRSESSSTPSSAANAAESKARGLHRRSRFPGCWFGVSDSEPLACRAAGKS